MAPRRDFRQTKIVCTLGPASSTPEQIEQLAAAGMNIARLNMSHGDHASHLQVIQVVQKLNERLNHPIALLLDLQGPAIRTGDRPGHLSLEVGQEFHVTVGPTENPEERTIHVDYQDMMHQLTVGDRITVDNGLINLEVLEVRERDLRCRVLDGGVLGSRKHINLPGVRINLPSISDHDVADIRFAAEHDVDFLAVSFVRSAEAVRDARRTIAEAGGHPMRIIAKIENQEGIDNLDEIIDAADGIMVARGDLGVEVEFEMLPVVQRDMVRRCAIAGKPVIVATHLLESMIDSPMPTRAEVTDVANAVYEQVDAVMLSGETATGKYPVRCVSVLDRIARRIEKERGLEPHRDREPKSIRDQLARSACLLADSLGSRAIVVMTMQGLMGGLVSSFRPRGAIIYAFTTTDIVRRRLWLSRSVVPFTLDLTEEPEQVVFHALELLKAHHRLESGEPVVIVANVTTSNGYSNAIQVRTIE